MTRVIERVTTSEDDTEALAAEIATSVGPPLVFLLDGDLGAGKTTFTRGFVAALPGGADVTVQSPTFALARTYPTTPAVHHLDLYRLEGSAANIMNALEELGLRDMIDDRDAFALVEWPRDIALPVTMRVARVTIRETAEGARSVRVELP